jgi:phosphopantothenoylcysteine synthetase/decarboxylase
MALFYISIHDQWKLQHYAMLASRPENTLNSDPKINFISTAEEANNKSDPSNADSSPRSSFELIEADTFGDAVAKVVSPVSPNAMSKIYGPA